MSDLRTAAQQALEAHANRYQVVRDGYWWRVKIGDGTQTVGQHHTETGALRLASELHRAFHDGGFVVQEALKAALEQPEQEPVLTINKLGSLMECSPTIAAFALPDGEFTLYTHPPRHETEQEPEACFIGTKGSAFDLPTTKRAYTYAEQPGNVASSKLGRALETARRCSAGDNIDAGLVLLKALQAEGFGVFQLGAEYTHPPRREWRGLTEEDIWTLAANCLDSVLGRLHFARAIEATLKERNA
jgi:hypothetical protein